MVCGIHTYSGYENAVKAAIEKSVVNRGMEDMILKIEIPMETVTEVTETGVHEGSASGRYSPAMSSSRWS